MLLANRNWQVARYPQNRMLGGSIVQRRDYQNLHNVGETTFDLLMSRERRNSFIL